MRGVRRVKQIAHRLRRQLIPGAVILMYHRVAELPHDPFNLAVSPDNFAQQLAHIRQTCQPMPLIELIEAIRRRSIPRRAVVITFDDGYVDNFTQAHPLLEAAQIPWTLFVAAGHLDSHREFWWDELIRVVLASEHLPERLKVSLQGQEYEWPVTTINQRQLAFFALYHLLLPLTVVERDCILAKLLHWAGLESINRSEYRPMTTAELVNLARSEYVDIGGHTLTHPFLSSLSPQEQSGEIIGSRQKLEAILERPVTTFSYPNGNYSPETVEIVEAGGFDAALTVSVSSIEAGDNPFLLGRCHIANWSINKFRQRLEQFFITRPNYTP